LDWRPVPIWYRRLLVAFLSPDVSERYRSDGGNGLSIILLYGVKRVWLSMLLCADLSGAAPRFAFQPGSYRLDLERCLNDCGTTAGSSARGPSPVPGAPAPECRRRRPLSGRSRSHFLDLVHRHVHSALQVFGSVVPKTAQGDHNAGRGAHLTSPPRTPVGVPPLFEGREAAYN
jgi:hypothetical protein